MPNKPKIYRRRPLSPITRYAYHLSSKEPAATQRALTLLFALAAAGVLRARNSSQLTFVFKESEEVLTDEDTDFLEIRGHATACRTVEVAGQPVYSGYSTLSELLAEFKHVKRLLKSNTTCTKMPPCSYFFEAQSDLSPLHGGIETWETDNN